MTKIIFFNGPPRSGKDTAALNVLDYSSAFSHIRDWRARPTVHFDRFAMPIKRAFAGMVNQSIDRFGNVEPYESNKSEVIPWLGVSYRQWQIDFSEGFLKQYGKDIFAKLFIQRNSLVSDDDVIVVPDSGFAEEVAPIAERFGFNNILLIRCHRPGYDFTGDSRSYVTIGAPDREHDVDNNTTVSEYHSKIDAIVTNFLRK